jgi:hypothetical protein
MPAAATPLREPRALAMLLRETLWGVNGCPSSG